MAVEMMKGKPSIGALLHIVGLVIAFIGAIIIWAVNKGSVDNYDWDAAVAGLLAFVFFIVAVLIPAFQNLRLFATGLVVFLVAAWTPFAELNNTFAKRGGKDFKSYTAGAALIIIGLWVGALGVFPVERAARAANALKTPKGMAAVGAMAISALASVLCWSYAGEAWRVGKGFGAAGPDIASTGQIVFMNIFIFGAAVFGENKHAMAITLFLGAYLWWLGLGLAINDPFFKKDLFKAAGVFVWISQLVQLVVAVILPAVMGEKVGPSAPQNNNNHHAEQQQQAPKLRDAPK